MRKLSYPGRSNVLAQNGMVATSNPLSSIAAINILQKGGILILHRNKNTEEKLPNYFKIIDERLYGISKITFGKFLS